MTVVAHKASPSRIRHPGLWVISGAFPSVRRRFPGSLLLGGAASARRATTGAWRRPPYLSSITSSPLPERPGVLPIPKRLRYCLECSPRRHREQHWPSRQGLLHAGNARDLLV